MIFSKSVFEGLEVLPFRRPAERGATPGPFAETPVHMIVPRVVRAEHAAQALRPVPGGVSKNFNFELVALYIIVFFNCGGSAWGLSGAG